MIDWTGQKVGNYQIVRAIGHGGFADVYLGQQVYLQTQAAIKILQSRLTANDLDVFSKEARTIAGLTHPNIVRVLEFGEQGQTPYLVMDYCPNGSLRQRYPRGSRLTPQECTNYVKQIASALQYAHDHRVIHRDVKPENILIGSNGSALLSDFGIATIAQSSRYGSQQDLGWTVAYAAPEQLVGKACFASDQYALGIVAYEWLTGDIPFKGSFVEIASQHAIAPLPSPREKVPTLSVAIEQVLQKALAKDPQQRFPSVQEFANQLEAAAYGQTSVPTYRSPQSAHMASSPSYTAPAPGTTGQTSVPTYRNPQSGNTASSPSYTAPGTTATHFMPPQGPGPSPSQANSTLYPPPITGTVPANASSSQWSTQMNTPSSYVPHGPIPMAPQTQNPKSNHSTAIIALLVALLVVVSVGSGFLLLQKNTSGTTGNGTQQTHTGSTSTGNTTSGKPSTSSSTSKTAPTPTPTSVAPGTLLYQADWSKDLNGWHGPGQWKAFQNGQIGSDGTSQNGFALWAPSQLPTSNYAVEASIQFVRANYPAGGNGSTFSVNNYEFGIMVRGDNNADGYEAGMTYLDDANLLGGLYGHPSGALIDLVRGDNNNPADDFTNGITPPSQVLANSQSQVDNNWHTYRVEVTGNAIKLYLDGALLVNTTDNTYITGTRVGLRSVYATINVSSFKVTAL